VVISTPTGEVENFLKEFRCITTAAGNSKWEINILNDSLQFPL
jgi:hypothetical protein